MTMQRRTITAVLCAIALCESSASIGALACQAAPPVPSTAPDAAKATPDPVPAHAARTASAFQTELVDLGFDAAAAIPVKPHERDRSRVQEIVALAALEVGLPTKSAAMANQIVSWRRGSVLAELAIDAARAGRREASAVFARQAQAALGNVERWQRERVMVKLAQAEAWLGNDDEARRLESGVGEPEQGKVASVRAATASAEKLDAMLDDAAKMIETANFDLVANALQVCDDVARRSAGDEKRWSRIEELLSKASGKVARDVQIRACLALAEVRVEQGTREAARALVGRAISVRDGARWTPDAFLQITAAIARTQHDVGDTENARAELDAAIAAFDAGIAQVADVFRAVPLCSVAEAFMHLGDAERARAVFARAIEEGARNPNARPRAEDLAQTCASMARAGVEPDEAMWSRLRAIRAGLLDPW
jgi:tetratricopeptide (TPR) repeat protein